MEKENIISVGALMNLYANSLTSTIDGSLLHIEGFYKDNTGKLYGKYFYDEILDKDKKSKITVQITADLKAELTTGNFYHFQGFINKAQNLDNDSRLKVFFRVTKVLKQDKKVQLISNVEYDIIRSRYDREFPIIEELLLSIIKKGSRPNIGLISGVDSTAIADYKSQLMDSEFYDITIHKCNLSSSAAMINLLDSYKLNGVDLLIIIRGGGIGLEIFDEVSLCRKFIEQSIPFITGIGHKEDVTLLQKVSDKAFATPTAVGVFLQKIADTHKDNVSLLEEKKIEIKKYKELVDAERTAFDSKLSMYKTLLIITFVVMLIGLLVFKFLF